MSKRRNKEEFIAEANFIHSGKFDYSNSDFKFMTKKIWIKCLVEDHGEFEQVPYAHLNGQGCPKCGIIKMTQSQCLTLEEFILKSIEIHGNKYGYLKAKYINNQTKITITCSIHGDFEQTPSNHLIGCGCPKCKMEMLNSLNRFDTEKFIQKAILKHGNRFDYSKVIYINAKTNVIIICPVHGEFEQLPYVHLLGFNCPNCKESKGEAIIAQLLDKNNIKYIREYRLPHYKFRYDFYLQDHNLFIEFHGEQHYKPVDHFGGEENFILQKERDMFKKLLAREYKIPLIELNDSHLKLNLDTLEQLLLTKINKL